jgi:hypothetical protein
MMSSADQKQVASELRGMMHNGIECSRSVELADEAGVLHLYDMTVTPTWSVERSRSDTKFRRLLTISVDGCFFTLSSCLASSALAVFVLAEHRSLDEARDAVRQIVEFDDLID